MADYKLSVARSARKELQAMDRVVAMTGREPSTSVWCDTGVMHIGLEGDIAWHAIRNAGVSELHSRYAPTTHLQTSRRWVLRMNL